MNLIVTTAQQTSAAVTLQAQQLAAMLRMSFIPRQRYSLAALREKYQVSELIVVTADGPTAYTETGKYFFHLSMAELRIKNIINGKHDHMVAAMGLTAGMSVLDCTLGLATDAIVASYVAGETGNITGLESSPVIALITRYGLEHFNVESSGDIINALRRIKVEDVEYSQYLGELHDNSFDIVYFDPMFRQPLCKSSNVNAIRALADMRELTMAALKQACRVARNKVVVKEAAGSREFARLKIAAVVGGKYSNIKYGIIDCANGGDRLWSV